MRKPDQFDYVNQYYGLNIVKHSPVEGAGPSFPTIKRGQVVRGKGQYIYIQWDGEPKPQGPYHPTSELSYPKEARASGGGT